MDKHVIRIVRSFLQCRDELPPPGERGDGGPGQDRARTVLVLGAPQSGKSHLLQAVAREMVASSARLASWRPADTTMGLPQMDTTYARCAEDGSRKWSLIIADDVDESIRECRTPGCAGLCRTLECFRNVGSGSGTGTSDNGTHSQVPCAWILMAATTPPPASSRSRGGSKDPTILSARVLRQLGTACDLVIRLDDQVVASQHLAVTTSAGDTATKKQKRSATPVRCARNRMAALEFQVASACVCVGKDDASCDAWNALDGIDGTEDVMEDMILDDGLLRLIAARLQMG